MYLEGQVFKILTDHRPLIYLFKPGNAFKNTSSYRIQRWGAALMGYRYSIESIKGEKNSVADCLSRLPLDVVENDVEFQKINLMIENTRKEIGLTYEELLQATNEDKLLSKIKQKIQNTTTKFTRTNFNKNFYDSMHHLTVINGLIFHGERVVIPEKLKNRVLSILHESHFGITKSTYKAQQVMWWPKWRNDIEIYIKSCNYCQTKKLKSPNKAPSHSWYETTRPLERVHIDFAIAENKKNYLIIVDSFSKWPEVYQMRSITTEETINKLRNFFARFGIPEVLVSDNGPQLVSKEMREFLKYYNIYHITTSPYHPAANGIAERFVQTFKKTVTKIENFSQAHLDIFLMNYRSSIHTTTNETPFNKMFKREMLTKLHNMSKLKIVQHHKPIEGTRELKIEQQVYVKWFENNTFKWIPGIIVERTGPVSYKVKSNSKILRLHIDQIKERYIIPDETVEIPVFKKIETSPGPRRSERLKNKKEVKYFEGRRFYNKD